ncbi:hypothetical protein LTS17_002690 [Exophiala oligosperma]
MGIPRLSQDLLPYAERTTLSSASQSSSQQETKPITSLIIDGPSLVYYIYNKLLAYKISNSPTLIAQQPSYEEINQCITRFLLDLDARGVEIQRLFFDGALPVSKREVRLERMEKLRQQLDAYRKTFPDFPSLPTLPDINYDKALWSTAIISSRKLTLPAPPFMVASVIESLQKSGKWRDTVQVVNGEADIFCAMLAKESGGCAILTNDSDMAVHDIGFDGRIVLLHSLEKRITSSSQSSNAAVDGQITALAFNPRQVAERLQVPSLLRFGFERYLDPSLSVSMVKERARQSDRLDDETLGEDYKVFSEQYEELPSTPTTLLLFPQQQQQSCIVLNDLDPRTAEVVLCFPDSSPNVYLTPMNEDPSRDSSWSYGSDIRHLAYSLLLLFLRVVQRSSSSSPPSSPTTMTSATPPDTLEGVTEYSRKGRRITSTTLKCLEVSQIQERISTLLQSLPGGGDKTTTTTFVSHSISESKYSTRHPLPAPAPSPPPLLLTWYTFALQSVNEQKLSTGKTPFSTTQVFGLFGLHDDAQTTASTQQPPKKLSWDEMHLLGNMHAVLYSLRILRQLTRYVMVTAAACLSQRGGREGENGGGGGGDDDDDDNNNNISDVLVILPNLLSKLDQMPSIQDLFLDMHDLRRVTSRLNLNIETRNLAVVTNLNTVLKSSPTGKNPSQTPKNRDQVAQSEGMGKQPLVSTLTTPDGDDGDDDGDWEGGGTTITKRGKRNKRKRRSSRADSSNKNKSPNNIFDLLGTLVDG